MAESRKNVSILDGVVVAGTENVGRDNGSEVVSELVVVGTRKQQRRLVRESSGRRGRKRKREREDSLVLDIHESLSVSVTEVALVGRTEMDLGLVKRVLDLIGEDTGGETRDELGDLVLVGGFEDVVVDEEVITEEGELLSHVSEKTSDWLWGLWERKGSRGQHGRVWTRKVEWERRGRNEPRAAS